MQTLYTIGYATKPIATFIDQLKHHQIDAVADVRSVPYSKRFHDYHKERIAKHLQANKIHYVYLGEQLGPRSKDPAHYNDCGQVQFERLMQSELFASGIARLQNGLAKNFRIALMCAEKDPATCHRSTLIGYFFQHYRADNTPTPIELKHIDHLGQLESQSELEQRLVRQHDLENDLFMSDQERALSAYQQQLRNTSYTLRDSTD